MITPLLCASWARAPLLRQRVLPQPPPPHPTASRIHGQLCLPLRCCCCRSSPPPAAPPIPCCCSCCRLRPCAILPSKPHRPASAEGGRVGRARRPWCLDGRCGDCQSASLSFRLNHSGPPHSGRRWKRESAVETVGTNSSRDASFSIRWQCPCWSSAPASVRLLVLLRRPSILLWRNQCW